MTARDSHTRADWITTSVGVRVRDDLCVIDLAGEDQRTWLNGQISNDVRETRLGDAVYALVLNVRGKILCDLWAVDRGDGFSLIVPVEASEALRAHLEQYIIMEDVTLSVRENTIVISVQGPQAREVASSVSALAFACDELGVGGVHVITSKSDATTFMERLITHARELGGGEVDDAAFELARLRRAVPRFGRDFDGTNYPQEAGLKQRAVSFSKGCYLGQEVVCTLESRGKLTRKLVALRVASHEAHSGDVIVTAAGDESGKLTSVAIDRAATRALGYVRRIHIDQQTSLHAASAGELTIDHVVGEN
jgi:hypothetical protein